MTHKDPLFLKFLNREVSVEMMLQTFSKSADPVTAEAALALMEKPPDLEEFWKEFTDAVNDIVGKGVGEEFKAFSDNYMEPSLEEIVQISDGQLGQNLSREAVVKNPEAPWLQAYICYNLCLYIKAFGLDSLKRCKVCAKFFCHKGKYAVYCSDPCKSEAKQKKI